MRMGPLRVKTVRGEPYHVGEWTLTPIVKVVSLGKARATVGSKRFSGWGGAFVWLRPLAVEVEGNGERRRVAITDGTAAATRSVLGVAVATALFFLAIRWVARKPR